MKATIRLASLLSASLLVACSDSDSSQSAVPNAETSAVIAAVAPDYGSSEISIASATAPFELLEGYASQALSDITVATNGNYFYRLGRFQQDNLTRYSFDTPDLEDWQFTTDDDGEGFSNPYDVLFVSDTKAYIIRYGDDSVWVVNPSVEANDEDNFKIGEIDLSAYDTEGNPEMAAAIIHEGILYVLMQALDGGFAPGQGYLAAIDTSTDKEIDMDATALKGIALQVKNPIDIEVADNSLIIAGVGRYERSWIPADPEYTGGIEKVSLDDYSHEILVDDGDSVEHPFGNIDAVAIVSDTQGYFRGVAPNSSATLDSLYEFNPTTGQVVDGVVADISGLDVQSIAVSPSGQLWVGIGDANAPEIRVIDPANNTVIDTIEMSMNPARIVFSDDLSVF